MSISSEKLRKVLHPIQIDTMHFRFKPRRNPGSQSQHRSVNRTAVKDNTKPIYRRGSRDQPSARRRQCRSSSGQAGYFGTQSISRYRAESLDAAKDTVSEIGRRSIDGGNHPPGQSVRKIRLDHRHAPCRGLAGEPQAGGTHLATGGAESPSEATKAGTVMAQ